MTTATQRCSKCSAVFPAADRTCPSCAPSPTTDSQGRSSASGTATARNAQELADAAYADTSLETPAKRLLLLFLSPVFFAIPIAVFFAVFVYPFSIDNLPVIEFFVKLFGPGARIVIFLILLSETAIFWRMGLGLLRNTFKKGTPSLNVAVAKGDRASISASLTAAGAVNTESRDHFGHTALHIAAFKGDLASVSALIAAGADVNARDKRGETPLHKAAPGNHVEVLRALLAAGANKEATDANGGTPLHQAAATKGLQGLTELIDAGANINALIRVHSITPLHLAAVAGRNDAVNLLLAAGADKRIKNRNGKTARDMAEEKGHLQVVRTLDSY